jgi:PAS domain S-box-containing protein
MFGNNSSAKVFAKDIDVEFLKNFANHIAMALDNATLYAKLQESEQKYREIVENVNEGIWMLGEDATIQYANQYLGEILGIDDLKGVNVYNLLDDTNKKILLKILTENLFGRMARRELQFATAHGHKKSVLLSSVPIYADHKYSGSLAIITDFTEQKNMEKQLLQVQKLESVGTMAGGIAHDFNNILTGILGYTNMLQHEMTDNSKLKHYADIIEKSSLRAADLVKKMLAFSRDSSQCVTEIVDVENVVTESMILLKSSLPKNIVVKFEVERNLPLLECDATHIQQAVLNLCLNARDAMPEGGTLIVSVDSVSSAELRNMHGELEISDCRHIRMKIADTGVGIDGTMKGRIFDPFFTTEEVGKGSGLGLAMVYGIVKGLNGHILVESEVGNGTVFELLFPVMKKWEEEILGNNEKEKMFVGTETVLMVDDEEIIRDLTKEVLEKFGYKVLLAKNGNEAVRIYKKLGSLIDITILDMAMPEGSGLEAYYRLRKINPYIKVLFCTAKASADTNIQNCPDLEKVPFVGKPFDIDDFSRKIRTVLGDKE